MLSDRGILQRRGRVLSIDADADIPMPDNVHALIAARLDTLPAERKALLYDASVTGKVFWSGAVSALGERDDREVREGLHELARKELVRPARNSSMEGQQEYSFWHALVRDVAYGQIPRPRRASKHQAVAKWLEGVGGARVADHAEVLAHHYGQALELARAAGQTAKEDELSELARRFLVVAAERAKQLDFEKARTLYAKALAHHPPGAERARLRLKLAEVLLLLGLMSDGRGEIARAIRELRQKEIRLVVQKR